MKTIITLLFLIGIFHSAKAQDYPAADQKWVSHHHLMQHGRATGKLSPATAKRLRSEYKSVVKTERLMKAISKMHNRELDTEYGKHPKATRALTRQRNTTGGHSKS